MPCTRNKSEPCLHEKNCEQAVNYLCRKYNPPDVPPVMAPVEVPPVRVRVGVGGIPMASERAGKA